MGWPRLSQDRGEERECIGDTPAVAAKCVEPYNGRASFEYKADARTTSESIDPKENKDVFLTRGVRLLKF